MLTRKSVGRRGHLLSREDHPSEGVLGHGERHRHKTKRLRTVRTNVFSRVQLTNWYSSLQTAAQDYRAYISRKIASEAVPGDDKLMHTEAFGIVMLSHGEEIGTETALGK